MKKMGKSINPDEIKAEQEAWELTALLKQKFHKRSTRFSFSSVR